MRNNIKKSIIVLSCLFACILPSNIFAVEDKNLEKITDFLSTCQIKSQNISISEPVPTYKDKKLFNNDMNYIVLTGNHIAGILTDTNGIFTYMDLSDKSIGNYIVTTVYAIEYRDIDILIYIDNIAYSVSKDEINTTTDFKKTTTKFNTEKISLLQTRSSSKYLSKIPTILAGQHVLLVLQNTKEDLIQLLVQFQELTALIQISVALLSVRLNWQWAVNLE